MLNTLGVIQIPPASKLPQFRTGPRLGGKSLLEWLVRRVTECQRLNGVVVLAAETPEAETLACRVPPDVPLMISSRADALSRVMHAVEDYPAESLVLLSVDNPFVDPVLIDRLVTNAQSNQSSDLVTYCLGDGRPTLQSPLGVYAEWVRTKALRFAAQEARGRVQREQVTAYLYGHPEKFQLRLIPLPPELDRDDVRMTIVDAEDWEHAQTLLEALGPEQLDWQRIAGLLANQPPRDRTLILARAGV